MIKNKITGKYLFTLVQLLCACMIVSLFCTYKSKINQPKLIENVHFHRGSSSLLKRDTKYCIEDEPGNSLIFYSSGIVGQLSPESNSNILDQVVFENYTNYIIKNDILYLELIDFGKVAFKITPLDENKIRISSIFSINDYDNFSSTLSICN